MAFNLSQPSLWTNCPFISHETSLSHLRLSCNYQNKTETFKGSSLVYFDRKGFKVSWYTESEKTQENKVNNVENSKNRRDNDEEKGEEEELNKDDGKMNDPRIATPYNPESSR